MPKHYTIVFTPSTWQTFKALPVKALGFRMTLATSLKKIEEGDVLLCYLAERMTWCGVLVVAGKPYELKEHIYSVKHGMPLILDVESVCLLDQQQEIPVKNKEIWDCLERFKDEDHRVNGWAVKVGLIRSLRKLSSSDGTTLKEAILNVKHRAAQSASLQA